MRIPDKWLNNPYTRFIWELLNLRRTALHAADPFVPYFKYAIGPYRSDHLLYFTEEPPRFLYIAEIFGKMMEYEGYDLIYYIEFHYNDFDDKVAFVRFLRYEVIRALKLRKRTSWLPWGRSLNLKMRMEAVLQWAEEEEKRLQEQESNQSRHEFERMLRAMAQDETKIDDKVEAALQVIEKKIDVTVNTMRGEVSSSLSMIGDRTDDAVNMIIGEVSSFVRAQNGKITVYNELHLVKLIQLLIAIQNAGRGGKNAQKVFKNFTDTDMVAIIRQFEPYGDKKPNTIQKEIIEARQESRPNDPVIMKLQKALDDFFFS